MKILVTGMTSKMCGHERVAARRSLYGRMQAVMYADELDAMGHEIAQYCPDFDEDLDHFDKIFVGIAPLSSLTANNFLQMGRILRCYNEKVILYVEDWSAENLTKDWFGKLGDSGWRKHLAWKKWAPSSYTDEARKGLLSVVQYHRCPWPVVCSMFPWGDHDALLGPSYECVALDVSPLIEYPSVQRCLNKESTWVLGALSDQSRWVEKQGFSWPVLQFGHRSSGQPRTQERELVQHYADNWGVLCPPYKKSGTGWWRNRYNWAAHVGSVLYCDEADGDVMDESYCIGRAWIETASDDALYEIAEEQRDWFRRNTWSREQFRAVMSDLLART